MVFDWNTEIRPVLNAVKKAIDSNGYGYAESDEINAVLGRAADNQATDLSLSKLRDAGFIEGYRGADAWSNCTLAEKGLQTVAGWPVRPGDDTYDLLLTSLAQRIEAAPTQEEESKWIKLRDGLVSAGRDLVVDVLSNVATQGM